MIEDGPEAGRSRKSKEVGRTDAQGPILGVDREDHAIVKGIDIDEAGLAVKQSIDGCPSISGQLSKCFGDRPQILVDNR